MLERIGIDRLLGKSESDSNGRDEEVYPIVRLLETAGLSSVFEATTWKEDTRIKGFGNEREQLNRFLERIESGTSVWDVGANLGLYTVFAARRGGAVHAFEPDPSFADRLRRNVNLNGQDATIHELALSDENGTTTLATDGLEGNSPALSTGGDTERGRATIETIRGDALVSGIPDPEVLKIDVEGAETGVLRGLGPRLSEAWAVMIELHPNMIERFGSDVEEARSIVEGEGFETAWEHRRDDQIHVLYER
jgi:FkbM family methyltransferase